MKYLLIATFIFKTIFAELPPKVYSKWQNKADETLYIKVVDIKTYIKNNTKYIYAKAKVLNVIKTKYNLQNGSIIDISYNKTAIIDPFIVGPSSPITLQKDKIYKAYLNKTSNNKFTIAAGGKSFKQE